MSRYGQDEPLDRLMEQAFLTAYDKLTIPDRIGPDWVEGSFKMGFLGALAMVGVDRRNRGGRVTRRAIREAVERLEGLANR